MFNYSNQPNGEATSATVWIAVTSDSVRPEVVEVGSYDHYLATLNGTPVTNESMKADSDATSVYFANLNRKTAQQRFQGNDRSHRASTRKGSYTDWILRNRRNHANRCAAFTAALEATND